MDENMNLADKLGELETGYIKAKSEGKIRDAVSIRLRMMELQEQEQLIKSIEELDFSNEFVRLWYADSD